MIILTGYINTIHALIGYYLEHLLFALGLHCFFINDYNLSDSFTRLVNEDDTVIFISLSGGTKKNDYSNGIY